MRLKTFSAPTMVEAMDLVRQEMGDDALVVSTREGENGLDAWITAAIEEGAADAEALEATEEPEVQNPAEIVRQALVRHGTPPRLIERVMEAATALEADTPVLALAGALDALFSFLPLAEDKYERPVMVIGPPGAGKTITAAKLAARATLAGIKVAVVTTDTKRAGGVEQLAAFTRILKLDLRTAETLEGLQAAIEAGRSADALFIDTPGTNPFSDVEMDTLTKAIRAVGAEPVLVLPAGMDAMEAADIATAFGAIGARQLLVTRLDIARRFGSILSAADAAHMTFSNVSITPHVADGLSPINPVSLARLMMPDTDILDTTQVKNKAAV